MRRQAVIVTVGATALLVGGCGSDGASGTGDGAAEATRATKSSGDRPDIAREAIGQLSSAESNGEPPAEQLEEVTTFICDRIDAGDSADDAAQAVIMSDDALSLLGDMSLPDLNAVAEAMADDGC